jgi:hypothetical protein
MHEGYASGFRQLCELHAKARYRFQPLHHWGLMCRSLLSVSWDGTLCDCDFNLAKGLFMGGSKTHVRELSGPPSPGSPVAVADHCYACTAGSGFTLVGAIDACVQAKAGETALPHL